MDSGEVSGCQASCGEHHRCLVLLRSHRAGVKRHLVGLRDFKSLVSREQRDRWVRFPYTPATSPLTPGFVSQKAAGFLAVGSGILRRGHDLEGTRETVNMHQHLTLSSVLSGAVLGCSLLCYSVNAAPPRLEFNRDVRPILATNCFACHGPDKGTRQAELRLDSRDGLLGTGEKPGVVIAGDARQSELYRRVAATDVSELMPPPETKKKLTPAQVSVLRRWIEEGAEWQGHWAYLPPERTSPPTVEAASFVRNDIDPFILAKLKEQGMPPAPEADPITLGRRLHFDLLGLPPTPERIEAFVTASSSAAYEALVDELLASPRYGERMAIFWLDLVRYADSVGYHGDQYQSTYPFRDYVIKSFNDNKPFDRFTLEQIAGDLLPEPTQESRVGAGYNRLNMMSAEGGGQDKEYYAKYASDRVRNTAVAWLGSTLGCAECHDHKYDPFTTRDFYSFAAYFADVSERGIYSGSHDTGVWGPTMTVPTPPQAEELQRLDKEIAANKAELERSTPELESAQQAWEKSLGAAEWVVLRPESTKSASGTTLTTLDDASVLASGPSPDTDTYTVTAAAPVAEITAVRLEALPHETLPKKGSGRAANGNFVLTEFLLERTVSESDREPVKLQNPSATFEQELAGDKTPYGRWSAEGAIDDDAKGPTFGWGVLGESTREQHAVFETNKKLLTRGGGERLVLTLRQNHGAGSHTLGRFRLSVTSSPHPVRAQRLPEKIASLLAVKPEQRNEAQRQELAAFHRTLAPALEAARKKALELAQARENLEKKLPRMLETVSVAPRTIRVLPRGNWMRDDGEVVQPGTPEFLPPAAKSGERSTRIDLAAWITSRQNPLTARVLVNRIWKLFFGAGLARRLDDLGSQGDWPSHLELLDWLAVDLQEHGWDIKRLVKQIVMSGAYRQASQVSREILDRDPFNQWLARQSRFRLDAEMIRDNALAVSGLLVHHLGGPSAKPYQPPGYWAYLNFPAREYQADVDENQYRRGVYMHWQRQYLHPSLLLFDAPSREECTAERPRSNTPLQALALLNDPSHVEAARTFAARILEAGGSSTADRLRFAFRQALSRSPTARELDVLQDLQTKHLDEYTRDPTAAEALLKVGLRPAPAGPESVELAAWTSVARVILNLHETITRS